MSRLGHAYLVSFTQEEICQSQQAKVNRMQSISHYIPYEQRIALAEDFELSSRTEGTVLFADISGFTPLTQSLSRELGGKRGAEELTDYLNEIYGRLIYQAHQYQGSIISFSGDAITCWFDAQGSNLLTTAKRAMTAAQLMQTVIAEMEEIRLPDGRLIRLGIKVGLASGPARRFVVGKSDIQKILTIAGKTLDYVANAEKLSNTGEIILAPETFVLLKDELDAVAVREGDEGRQYTTVKDYQGQVEEAPWPQITADTPLEKQIEWLLPPVHQRLLEGQENFLAELRPTVPLFLRFDGIDYDHDEEAGQKLDLFIQWVQSVVNSYSGHLIQLTIGDKGSYLYVTFGALIANEDDPVRALLSADILKNIPPRLNFISSIQIGVSYGHTYTGAYGGEQRKTYGVLGNDVNLAARLMGMAQDRTVFVSSRIKKATENAFDFASMGLKKIKGLDEPIPIFELGQRKASFSHNSESTLDAVVFGREAEKAVLNERLTALVQQNQGSTVIIRGEAGMGKSQLVGYLMQQIEQLSDSEKTAVYIGAGSSIEKSTPYHGWRSIFSEIFDLTSIEYGDTYLKDAEQAIRSKLAEVDPEFEQLLPLLSQILQVSIEDNELTAQMVGQARANSTNKLLIQTLKQINDSTPLTLIIEDTHWLDSSSWTLLEEVRNSLDSMLLVIVTRPSFDKTISKLEVIESKENVYPLDIDSMPQEAIEALICHRLKATSIPKPLLNIITTKAEGNPFFSEEIAYALRDTGIIRIEDGVCHIADGLENLNTFQFPDNIHGIITSRIDSLHPSHQLSLKVASIIGRTFTLDAIHSIHPIEQDDGIIHQQLQSLESNEFTIPESPEPDITYLFKHIVIWEVAYSLMTFSQRKALHQSTAEWYENEFKDNLSPYYPLLVHHWRNAEDIEKSIFYLEKAGLQAVNSFANPEAIYYYKGLFDLVGREETRPFPTVKLAQWHYKLGEAYFHFGDLEKGRAELEKALDQLGFPIPKTNAKIGFGLLKLVGQQTRHRLQNFGDVPKTAGEDREKLLLAAIIYERLSTIMYFLSNTLGLLYCSLQTLNLSERAGPSTELARAYATLAVVAGAIPLQKLAETYHSRALQIESQVNQPLTRAFVLNRLAIYDMGVGDWSEAEAYLEKAIEINDDLGERELWFESLGTLGWFCIRAGLLTEGEKWNQLYYDWSKKAGIIRGEQWGLCTLGQIKLQQGEIDTAVLLFSEGLPLSDKNNDGNVEIVNSGLLAWAYALQGNVDAAQDAAVHGTLIARDISVPVPYIAYIGYGALTKAWLTVWEQKGDLPIRSITTDAAFKDSESIKTVVNSLVKVLKSYAKKYPYCLPFTLQCEAKASWLSNDKRQAISTWEKGIAFAREKSLQLPLGLTLQDLGIHLADDPARQESVFNEAKEIYTELGMSYYASTLESTTAAD